MSFKYDQTKKEEVNKLIALIIDMYDPEKIVLFGSQARGDWHKDSDFDILIVNSSKDTPAGKLHSSAYKANIKIKLDVFKVKDKDLEKYKNNFNHALGAAQRDGVEIFVK